MSQYSGNLQNNVDYRLHQRNDNLGVLKCPVESKKICWEYQSIVSLAKWSVNLPKREILLLFLQSPLSVDHARIVVETNSPLKKEDDTMLSLAFTAAIQ